MTKTISIFSITNNANINEIYFAKYKSANKRYEIIVPTQLLDKSELNKYINDNELSFGNFPIQETDFKTTSPNAIAVAKWAYIFGNDLVTFDNDFLDILKNGLDIGIANYKDIENTIFLTLMKVAYKILQQQEYLSCVSDDSILQDTFKEALLSIEKKF